MGQSVDVVVSELHSASARLADAAQRLQDGLSSVDDETKGLLGSGWKGDAASAFGTAWDQWHGGAEQVIQGLQRMSELLTVAGKEYAKIDEQAAALGSSMPGSGGSGGSGAAFAWRKPAAPRLPFVKPSTAIQRRNRPAWPQGHRCRATRRTS